MTLQEYIDKHHSGNTSDFARKQDIHMTQVVRWLKYGATVDGNDIKRTIASFKSKEIKQ